MLWLLGFAAAIGGAWWLGSWISRPEPTDPRCERAVAAFSAKYPDRLVPERAFIQPGHDGSMVVTVVYPWAGVPPMRSWWRIDGGSLEELEDEAAAQLIDIPAWR